jgi:hypothetical protein
MDPAFTLKRTLGVDLKLCIFCQKHNKSNEVLKESTEYSRNVVHDAMIKRQKLKDIANREVSDRLNNLLATNQEDSIVWHRNCYAQFTSKEKIQRLEQKHVASGREALRNETITSTGPRKTQSHVQQVNWEQCIFCQNEHSKERLSSVMTFKMSENVIQNAQYNFKVRVRLSGVSDLIAAEAKYHLPCLSAFNRYAEKAKREVKETDQVLVWLCE